MAIKFDVNKEVTSRLKFKPNIELNNLCLGVIEKVEVKMYEIAKVNEKTGQESTWEYAGHTIPQLEISFKNYVRKDDKDKADRFYTHRERIIGSLRTDGSPIEDSTLGALYESMWDRIKHIHDAFSAAPNYKAIESLPSISEHGEVAKRVEQFTKFFQAIADAFNEGKGGKAIFVDAEDKKLPLWMKLVAEYKEGKWLQFPTFVGEGFIELYKPGVPPTIEVKPGESVVLRVKGEKKGTTAAAGSEDLPAHILDLMNE